MTTKSIRSTKNNSNPLLIKTRWLSLPYSIWMIGFIIIPLIVILYYGLTSSVDNSFTIANIKLIMDPVNLRAIKLSLQLSLISTLLCLLMAYPLAMILTKSRIKSNSFIVMVLILPMWMNSLLRTIAWQNLLERNGLINTILNFLNLPSLEIINTPTAIVLGMVYNFLPFMILPIYNVLSKIDIDVINAAKDLGANNRQTFFKITLPLSLPGVISGIIMVFVPSLTTFVISVLLGGSKVILIGNVIEQQFRVGDWHGGSGLSLVLMIFILLSMAILSKYDNNKESGGSGLW